MKLRLALLAVGYGGLIAYASLYPFSWEAAGVDPLGFLTGRWAAVAPRADNLANVLAYLPLGLLLALSLPGIGSFAVRVILATLAGVALSFSMEFFQQYLPGRVPSQADLATNACGALIGALLSSSFHPALLPGRVLVQGRARWVKPGRHFNLGLLAVAAWALSQWLPGVPSFSVGNLRSGLAPVWHTAQDLSSFDFSQWGRYTLYISGLALLVRTLGNPGRPAVSMFFLFAAGVLAYKIPVVGRQLSLEAVAGALSAMLLTALWLALRIRTVASIAALFIAGGLICAHFLPGQGSAQHLSNWAPLRGPIDHPVLGLGSVLEILWPPAALGYLARIAAPPKSRRAVAWGGGVALAVFLAAMDWQAQSIPLATIFLMAGTWTLFGLLLPDPSADLVVRPNILSRRMSSPAVHTWAAMVAAAVLIASNASDAQGATIRVDPQHEIKSPSAAARIARDGDLIAHLRADGARRRPAALICAAPVTPLGSAEAQEAPRRVTPKPVPSDEFDELARAPNVVRALRGNEPGFVTNDPKKYWLPEGSMRGGKTRPVYDAQVGGLRFDIVPVPSGQQSPNIAGAFYFNFGRHFGPNERFRVRWQQMFNEPMLNIDVGETAIKQAIIGSGDGPGLRPQASCTVPEIVVTTFGAFRLAHIYHSCGRYWPMYGAKISFQNMQPAVAGLPCDYDAVTAQRKKGERVRPPAACAAWAPAMQWQDYALEVENGAIDPVKGHQYLYSVVRLYVGQNADGTLHLAHEWDSRKHAGAEWNRLGLFVGNAATNERFFGKFWGLPYMTGYKAGHTQLMQTWYRHFIVTDETRTPPSARPGERRGEPGERS